jgi:predicted transcriptional regulator
MKERKIRSKIEIDIAILQATKLQIRLTHIMYKATIKLSTLKLCLEELENKGLIYKQKIKKKHGKGLSATPIYSRNNYYTTTPKGHELLNAWAKLQTLYQEKLR